MFLTNCLLKKAKSKRVVVLMESVVSGFKFTTTRERLGDKREYITYDPYIRQLCVFKERKKIGSV